MGTPYDRKPLTPSTCRNPIELNAFDRASMRQDTLTIDDRMQPVIHAWLIEHHGQPVRLQRTDVHEIVLRLLEARLQPTVEAIRRVNGGKGSPNVIHPAVRDFFMSGELQRRLPRPHTNPDVPKPLMALWNDALESARQVAWAGFAEDRAAATEAVQELERERADFMEQSSSLKERANAQDALLARLQQELGMLREEVGRLKSEAAHLMDDRDEARRAALADRKALVEAQTVRRELEAQNRALHEQLQTLNNTVRAIAESREDS